MVWMLLNLLTDITATICLIVITLSFIVWLLIFLKKSQAQEPPSPTPAETNKKFEVKEGPEPIPLFAIEYRRIYISAHSIDRASTRHHKVYIAYREHKDDGLYSWLMREMKSLRASGHLKEGQNEIDHFGVLWAVVVRHDIVILKSLSFKKGKHRRKKPLSNNQIEKLKRRKGNARNRE